MSVKPVIRRIFAFKISTPLVNTETEAVNDEVYVNEIFETFLSNVLQQDPRIKPLKDGQKYFDLHSFKDSDDSDFIEGVFHTTRYGMVHKMTLLK